MSITNYTELQTAIGNWLDRADLTARLPEFIALAEAEIGRRLRMTTVRGTLTLSSEETALPAACAELRSIYLSTSSPSLDYPLPVVPLEQLAEQRARSAGVAGRPKVATVYADTLVVAPAPDQAYTAKIAYFEALTPLSGTNTTNSVLTEAPDVYLYGSLKHALIYLEHEDQIPYAEKQFEAALSQLETQREREELQASLRPVRLPRVFG